MTPTEFIKEKLKVWNDTFDGIHIRYAFEGSSFFHIVEIDPESIRRGCTEYKKQELAFWRDFVSHYPTEYLLITRPSDTHNMSNVIYTNVEEAIVTDMRALLLAKAYFTQVVTPNVKKPSYTMNCNVYALAA